MDFISQRKLQAFSKNINKRNHLLRSIYHYPSNKMLLAQGVFIEFLLFYSAAVTMKIQLVMFLRHR